MHENDSPEVDEGGGAQEDLGNAAQDTTLTEQEEAANLAELENEDGEDDELGELDESDDDQTSGAD